MDTDALYREYTRANRAAWHRHDDLARAGVTLEMLDADAEYQRLTERARVCLAQYRQALREER